MTSLSMLALLLLVQARRLLALLGSRELLCYALLAVCQSPRGFPAELLLSPQSSACVIARSSSLPGAAFLICPCISWGSSWPILPACLGPSALFSSVLTGQSSLMSSADLIRVPHHLTNYEVVKQDWSPSIDPCITPLATPLWIK